MWRSSVISRTIVLVFIAIFVVSGCGDSSSPATDINGTDSHVDVITGVDVAGDVGRDQISGDSSADDLSRDLNSDGFVPPPCRPGDTCDDFDPCTVDDYCDADAECAGVVVEECDDGIDCTFDECASQEECTHDVKPGWCFIDGKCIEDGEIDPAVICRSCQTALKNDQLLPDDNLSCDDLDACTVNDRCHEGLCVADAMNCNDNNSCTADMCSNGSCVYENVEGMCNDGNLCTESDLCVDGVCKGSLIGCWDQNSCTQDACHPDFGCIHEFLDIPCDDENICTVGDACFSGTCISGEDRLDCDDENICTDDGCVPVRLDGCVHIPNADPCDDLDPCTLNDTCKAGDCVSGVAILDCDDGNICTSDRCEPFVGCINENNTAPCDDGEPCGLNDVCGGGTCNAGATDLVCDDSNECTTDSCVIGEGCLFTNNTNFCDDDNVCTLNDICGDGACIGSPVVGMCDDDNDCTLDYCLPTGVAPGCYHKALPECRPQIIIDYPPRGATLNGSRNITVRGHIEYPKDGLIVGFVTLNGMDVMVNPVGWTFEADMYLLQGMNPIVAYGQDVVFGYSDYVVQSAYYSDTWVTMNPASPQAAMIFDGVKIFLGKTVWDDNDTSTADDIATLLTNIVSTLDISTLITNPVTSGGFGWCDYKVNLKHISYGRMAIDLVPDWGKLKVKVVIPNFKVDVDIPVSGFACPDFDGTATATSITINADLNMVVDSNGNPQASLTNPDVVVAGLDVDIGGIWGFLLNWIVDFFESNFATMIEDAFETELAGSISDLIEGAVADLALEPEFEIPSFIPGMQPIKLQLISKFSTIAFTPAGSDIGLAAAFMPDRTTTPPRQIRGSIGRGTCLGTDFGEPVLPHTNEMELFAKDDVLNEALYAAWASGGLIIPVGPELLGDVDLTTYGISNMSMLVEFMLPPIISDCNVAHKMFFQAGDIKITANMKLFGSMMKMTMYSSLIAEARIVLVPGVTGTEVGIQVETPLFIDIEVAQIDGGLVGAEDTISQLIRGVAMPMVLDMLTGDTLASFQLPAIDLSSLAPGMPAGAVIQIEMKAISRSKGATIIEGNVK